MNPVSILLLGLAMSTDAFAAALAKGAGMVKPTWPQALRIGLIFGVVEAITPMIGWLLGSAAARFIEQWDHWVAFALLFALGLHMLYKAFLAKEEEEDASPSGSMWSIALTGLATSIDAMAVGVGLAFVQVNIVVVSVVIGLCTFTLVTIGIMAGRVLSAVIGKWAEALGGLVLIAVGATILYEHLSAGVAP
ncbi:manganese efflux pump MntP family protein [Pseudoxanthomonas mexicana]|uniref:manganese efflux pump MntP n=1 Tax=Pseudoxanthomonas mexicana TaxID=128785 RepID=UPI0022F405C7|nr:manganese efflux pump MntP family protein [Pseudoxanthomonas mexicana]WBX93137.1 manganese efflux pump MntP family protein [Pseudoxanthomonas mexicana]